MTTLILPVHVQLLSRLYILGCKLGQTLCPYSHKRWSNLERQELKMIRRIMKCFNLI